MYYWAEYTIKYAIADRNSIDNPINWEWKTTSIQMEDGDFQIDDLNCLEFVKTVSKHLYITDAKVIKKTVTKHHLTDYDYSM